MKVLIIPSWYSTEEKPLAGIFFKEHAEALVRYGHEAAILYIDIRRGVTKTSRGITVSTVNGVKEFRYSNLNFTPKFAYGVNWQRHMRSKKMFDLIEKTFGKPDIIHLESCEAADVARKAREKWNIPVVYTEHLSLVLNARAGYYEKMFKKAIVLADACVAISSVFQNKIMQYRNSEIYRIPNGIDTKSFVQSVPGKVFTIKALGSLRLIKGYDVLIRAFDEFARGKNNVKLVIGGDGTEREHLEQIVKSMCCRNNIFLIGNVAREAVPHFYENCSVFVCSSKTETFSIVTIEALCSGVPVVATKCGGPEDMIDSSNGILVEVDDVNQLAAALETVYNKFDSYNREKIREAAGNKFDYKKIVQQHEDLYERVKNGYLGKKRVQVE